jgi:hypothetical protein
MTLRRLLEKRGQKPIYKQPPSGVVRRASLEAEFGDDIDEGEVQREQCSVAVL